MAGFTEARNVWAQWTQLLAAEIKLTQRCSTRVQAMNAFERLTGLGPLVLSRADRRFQQDLDEVVGHQYCDDCDPNHADTELDYTHAPYCHSCQQEWPCAWIQAAAEAYGMRLPELAPTPEPTPETRWTKETEAELLSVVNSNLFPGDKVREMLRYLAENGLLKSCMDYEPSP